MKGDAYETKMNINKELSRISGEGTNYEASEE